MVATERRHHAEEPERRHHAEEPERRRHAEEPERRRHAEEPESTEKCVARAGKSARAGCELILVWQTSSPASFLSLKLLVHALLAVLVFAAARALLQPSARRVSLLRSRPPGTRASAGVCRLSSCGAQA